MSTVSSSSDPAVSGETKPPRIIKRYPNRKLYDIKDSCYVTLEEIADIVRDGEEVRIFDSKTHEDLTSVTLAQIIYEQEKKRSLMPLSLLISMVRNSGAQIGGHIRFGAQQVTNKAGSAIRRVVPSASAHAQQTETRRDEETRPDHRAVDSSAFPGGTEAGALEQEKTQASSGASVSPEKNHKGGKFQQSIGEWHRELDSRVHQTIEQLSSLPTLAREMDVMERRIRELEAKLEELDNT